MAVVKTFQNKPAKFVPQETRRNLAASNVKTNRRNLSSLKTKQRKIVSNKAIKTIFLVSLLLLLLVVVVSVIKPFI